MATWGQPHAELAVVVQEHLALPHHEDRNRKVSAGLLRAHQAPHYTTRALVTRSLPGFDLLYGVDQHEDVEQQAIPYPEDQSYLRHDEERERTTEPEAAGQHEPEPADQDVADRVHDRVTVVAERGRLGAVSAGERLPGLGPPPPRPGRGGG